MKKMEKRVRSNIFDNGGRSLGEEAYTIAEEEIVIVDELPNSFMSKKNLVPTVTTKKLRGRQEKVLNLRAYFKIDNLCDLTNLSVACRSQEKIKNSKYSLAAWLEEGRIKANNIKTDIFDKEKLKSSILEIRKLTFYEQDLFHDELINLLSKCGIALVLVGK